MRKIVIEVPENYCKDCSLNRLWGWPYARVRCPFRRGDGATTDRAKPVKACRDAEIKEQSK
jgi:hypothetical protein